MRIFFGVGEPSGDLHAANLIRELHKHQPDLECVGFGGERMQAAGAHLLYPLCSLAVVGFTRVFANLHRFVKLFFQAKRYFREHRPDAVVLVDYPGFNWWLARSAHAQGIPVFYFVPPQIWAWAGWRIRKMRRTVDHVLCTLQFEEDWYRQRGVDAHYIGHPYFDELSEQQLNAAFVEQHQEKLGPIIGLLPGSRDQEVELNLPTLLASAAYIHSVRPDTRFLMGCFKADQAERASAAAAQTKLPIEVHVGRTAEIIHLSHSLIAVSGSVSLELLYRKKPAMIIYKTNRIGHAAAKILQTCPYICLVNLLSGTQLFPEWLSHRFDSVAVGGFITNWLNDYRSYKKVCNELDQLRSKVLKPGACARAAEYVMQEISPAQEKVKRTAA
jgi:lipid-A-disaccharide synthase